MARINDGKYKFNDRRKSYPIDGYFLRVLMNSNVTLEFIQNWILKYKIKEENLLCQKKKMICLSLLYLALSG